MPLQKRLSGAGQTRLPGRRREGEDFGPGPARAPAALPLWLPGRCVRVPWAAAVAGRAGPLPRSPRAGVPRPAEALQPPASAAAARAGPASAGTGFCRGTGGFGRVRAQACWLSTGVRWGEARGVPGSVCRNSGLRRRGSVWGRLCRRGGGAGCTERPSSVAAVCSASSSADYSARRNEDKVALYK